MTISEALDYIEDINSTVSWTKEQETDREFFENVEELLIELKVLREYVKNALQHRRDINDIKDELIEGRKSMFKDIENDMWIDAICEQVCIPMELWMKYEKEIHDADNIQ